MKKYSFKDHPEHEARLEEWRDRWIKVALRTDPQTVQDREACIEAVRGLYKAANFEEPRIVFSASPISAAIAAVFASCVWWFREHPEQCKELFGRPISESDLKKTVTSAVVIAVCAAKGVPVPKIAPIGAGKVFEGRSAQDVTQDAFRNVSDALVRQIDFRTIDRTIELRQLDLSQLDLSEIEDSINRNLEELSFKVSQAVRYVDEAVRPFSEQMTTRISMNDAVDIPTQAEVRTAIFDSDIQLENVDEVLYDVFEKIRNAALDAVSEDSVDFGGAMPPLDDCADPVTLQKVSDTTRTSSRIESEIEMALLIGSETDDVIEDALRTGVDKAALNAFNNRAVSLGNDVPLRDHVNSQTVSKAQLYLNNDGLSKFDDIIIDILPQGGFDITHPLVRFLLTALYNWAYLRNGGNQWAGWCAYISFFREIAKLDLKEFENWIHYENAAIHGGPRFMHMKFCIVSDFPTRICRDEQNRLHSATGPAVEWSDGWKAYCWRGINVPSEWIEAPKTVDVTLALTHENIEKRRCLAEILGWDKILEQLNAVSIDKDPDPLIGELLEVDLPESGKERFLRVLCGTGRRFAIPVPPDTKTAIEAQCWIHNLDEAIIRKLEKRT
jgi:hypothetical protein